ncbi:Xyloglucan endotransglucosylase/hydrolase [Parasponia andersonii]|uniref:Xyloglucan endotransglucosylase/hydrolase n=1 Tax=Parasponia andersonii TaxID=3476 RepID=A0A2P5DC05_PARAD|nr:Xyloglucan endotransglucosylase/hydrolase [Parasponia andersonii]
MRLSPLTLLVSLLILCITNDESEAINDVSYADNYFTTYGEDHLIQLDQGKEIQLTMDLASGTGFMSKRGYGSGYFQMKIKIPKSQSPGVLPTFYLTSLCKENNCTGHDELDFEFIGTDGPPFHLQTNIYSDDNGGREQRTLLWFDPSQDFHQYGILWNKYQIVFFVDNVPVRVYKNLTEYGGRYPSKEMFVTGSIWEGMWASGGKPVDWSKAPFEAHYREFDIYGCEYGGDHDCSTQSEMFWWNTREYWFLSPKQQSLYQNAKKKYVYDDYCVNRGNNFTECQPQFINH